MVPFAGRAGKKTSIDAAPAVWAVIIFSATGQKNVTEIAFHIFHFTFFCPVAEKMITAAVCFSIRRLI